MLIDLLTREYLVLAMEIEEELVSQDASSVCMGLFVVISEEILATNLSQVPTDRMDMICCSGCRRT